MKELEIQLQSLQKKLLLLLKQHQLLVKENAGLKAEVERLQSNLDNSNSMLEKLQQEIVVLKLNPAPLSDDEKKQLETRINAYLKDIEKCLTLLNS